MPEADMLDQHRQRAQELLEQYRAGAPAAIQRIEKQIPHRLDRGEADARNIGLAQTQLVVAREAGYSSWSELLAALQA
ncbi:MAG: hypothetical protein ACYTG5_19365 [Planctomycetota bacterium]|jgi:hypothetical protein